MSVEGSVICFHKFTVVFAIFYTSIECCLVINDQAKESMMKQKRAWLQHKTLHTEIQELVLDHRLQSSHNPLSSNAQVSQLVAHTVHCL